MTRLADGAKTCAVTGSSGYVGRCVASNLRAAGWNLTPWSRRADGNGVRFQLGTEVSPDSFAGMRALVHCAYDFTATNWDDISSINVQGSENLLRAAHAAGVERIGVISSASAFPGCRSLYGRAKLEIEQIARSIGAVTVRPGLVWGKELGGVFGGLAKQASTSRMIPMVAGGTQRQYMLHERDLSDFVLRALDDEVKVTDPVLLAHDTGWTLRQLIESLAATHGRRPVIVNVPWQAAWVALKSLELLGVSTPFRSDSLVSLVYQNQHPDWTLARQLRADAQSW